MEYGSGSKFLIYGNFYRFFLIGATAVFVPIIAFFHAAKAAMTSLLFKKSCICQPAHAIMQVHGSPCRRYYVDEGQYGEQKSFHFMCIAKVTEMFPDLQ